MVVCGRCGESKTSSEFGSSRHNVGRSGAKHWCKPCEKSYLRAHRISEAEYLELWNQQAGLCAICGKAETRLGGRKGTSALRLSVDRDRSSGAIRGLLCQACNMGLGQFRDDAASLERAARYLRGVAVPNFP